MMGFSMHNNAPNSDGFAVMKPCIKYYVRIHEKKLCCVYYSNNHK